jgi:hypothetical protein
MQWCGWGRVRITEPPELSPLLFRQAAERRATQEAELAARLAHEARAEFEREEAARREAKEALKAFLLKCAGQISCPSYPADVLSSSVAVPFGPQPAASSLTHHRLA